MWLKVAAVAVGGAVGAMLRFGLAWWSADWTAVGRFPIGTFMANVLGGFLIGALYAVLRQNEVATHVEGLVLTGFLGALTTFSTFGLEVVLLYESGAEQTAVGYFLLTNMAVVTAVVLGLTLFRTA